jgi:DNA gyrase subunit A
MQAKVHIEEMSRNRNRLVITELPYQTNKSSLTEKIAELAREGKLEGVADLRDESDRQGMRLVLELTRTVEPQAVLKQLFKMTPLQNTFSINMLALVDGEPRLVSLKRALQFFIEHRQEIITRRSQYELEKAQQRAHILEGLQVALANLDEVISLIRSSRSTETAKTNLRKTFKLSEAQATAILDMPLRRLAAIERKKIDAEHKELLKDIAYLQGLLKSRQKILAVIKDELIDVKETYSTPRRTLIVEQAVDENRLFTARDLLPDEKVVVALTQSGQLCRWNKEAGLDPARGPQPDPLIATISAHTRKKLYLFTAGGQALPLAMHQVPEGSAPGDGLNLAELRPEAAQPVIGGIALANEDSSAGYLFLVSRQGRVKRINLSDLQSIRGHEAMIMGLERGDALVAAFVTSGEGEVVLATAMGQAIRFAEEEVRPMGLAAAGVWGMKLAKNDEVVGAGPVTAKGELLVVTELGLGKRIKPGQFSKQGRHGQGIIAQPTGSGVGRVVAAAMVQPNDRVLFISQKKNSKMIYAKSLPQAARTHKGSSLMAIKGRDRLTHFVTLSNR